MPGLNLTDKEAHELILIAKELISFYNKKVKLNDRDTINIRSKDLKYDFYLDYLFELQNVHLNFRDGRTNLTLVRVNLDDKFHKNSDGNRVRGNRIEIFSEKEYLAKNDTITHIKAYPLPFKNVRNTNDFLEALQDILKFTNTNNEKLKIYFEKSLF